MANKKNVNETQMEVSTDVDTARGQFVNAFSIRMGEDSNCLLDLFFETPEEQTILVSRTIMSLALLQHLSEVINKKSIKKNSGKK